MKKIIIQLLFCASYVSSVYAQSDWIGYEEQTKVVLCAESSTTSSGEAYNAALMEAAHTNIPLNSMIEVNAAGKSVIVRINNRLDKANGKLLCLTPAAAKVLGISAGQGIDSKIKVLALNVQREQPRKDVIVATATSPQNVLNLQDEAKQVEVPKEVQKQQEVKKQETKKEEVKKETQVAAKTEAKDNAKIVAKTNEKANTQAKTTAKTEIKPKNAIDPLRQKEKKTKEVESKKSEPRKVYQVGKTYTANGVLSNAKGFGAQVHVLASWDKAKEEAQKLKGLSLGEVFILVKKNGNNEVFKVVVGKFASQVDASGTVAALKEQKYDAFTVQY